MVDPSRSSGVYSIVNHRIGRVYLGAAVHTFTRRWSGHRYELNLGKHNNRDLQQDWYECGVASFDFVIACPFTPVLPAWLFSSLEALERQMIFVSENWLYNVRVTRPYSVDKERISWLDPYRL